MDLRRRQCPGAVCGSTPPEGNGACFSSLLQLWLPNPCECSYRSTGEKALESFPGKYVLCHAMPNEIHSEAHGRANHEVQTVN